MKISVIIPVLNEEDCIAETIAATREIGECEILVVDGGSKDRTAEAASTADRVIASPRGRSTQQNLGAEASTGDVLVFLHADCRLPQGSWEAIRSALADRRIVGGCFRQRIDQPGWKYRLMEWGNNTRVRLFRWAYGDQGIFVRRSVFEELGGFPDLRLMEDLYFMKRLKRLGKIRLLDPAIHVSARRWEKAGYLRQTLRNWSLITLAHCGISPDHLAKFYPQIR